MAIKLDEAKIRRLSTNGVTTIAGGHIYLTGAQAGSSTGNTTQIVFGTTNDNHIVLSSNDGALVINPTTSSTTNQIVLYLNQKSKFPGGIDAGTGGITTTGNISGNYIQGTWLYTSAATAQTTTSKIAVIHSDNYIYYITPANLTTLIKNNASGTWGINVSGSSASCTGNAATATKLATARAINGTNFDGTGAITTANWGTARTLTIGDVAKSVNGSTNYTWSNSELRFIKWDDALSNAKLMHKDPMFYSGLNGMSVYNNSGGSHVTVTRIASPSGCPTPSGYCAQIQTIGTTTSPGYGGFYQSYTGRANAVFLIRYLIKLPVGYKLVTATNSMGDGYSDTFITDPAGTGNWTWYIRRVKCGSTGSFSSGGHVYVTSNGATTTPSSSNPITWYVGAIYCYDLSASLYTGNNFIDTNVTSAKYLVDKTNGTATYLNYGAAGLSTTSWFAAWNGYELRAISPTVSRATMSAMSAISANGYYGMGTPDGTTSTWIRTTTLGIIPYNSGGASALGTSSWPFSNAYINIVYGNLSGTASYATADASGNTITTSYLRRYDWWTSGNGNNVDTLRAGTTFAYNNHNAPTTGTIVAFDCRGNENYTLQLMGAYQDTINHLYFRNRNGDGNKWGAWRTILDNNNYTDYTVTKTGSGASGTWGISISGNAATATKLGTSTVGAADRPIYLNSGTATQTTYRMAATNASATSALAITSDLPTGIWYVSGTSEILGQSDGVVIANQYSGSWITEIYQDYRTGQLAVRGKNNGTWQSWRKVLDSTNYSSYALPLAGGTMNAGAQILRASSSQSWVNGRKGALLAHAYASANRFTSNQYNPLWSAKSINGSWDCGTYTANNNLYFTYITDTNFDAGTNTTTHQVIISGNDGKITASGFVGPLSGNASTASSSPKLTTSGSLTSSTIDSFLEAGVVKWGTGDSTAVGSNDGIVVSFGWSASYGAQMWLDDGSGEGGMKIRNRNGGTTWNPWRQVLTENNYSSYAAPASHTHAWSAITGKPSTFTPSSHTHAWGDITGKPSTFTPSSHTHNYLTSFRTVSGDSHAVALKNEFTNNKSSIPRNSFVSYYSSAMSNGSYYMGYFLSGYDSNPYGGFFVAHYGTPYYVGISNGSFVGSQLWKSGDSVTGAVWNDYAEYRESDCKEFGRVLAEKGDDTLTQTTERLQPFAGVSSDTWGFCQGETEKAKTPIAVAGRVLVYTYRNRKEYKPGDVVCAAPNGTVDIMTREEIITYPDRIVGTVSCVPEYETWGSGDRDPVKVNNRIWIKVN